MKRSFLLFVLSSVLLFSGCSNLMHPKADEFYAQAKGATGKQTALDLLAMMEASAQQAYTFNKELEAVFRRLWNFKNDTALRAFHLDLFSDRLKELKKVLQSIPL